ncbi:MAG: VCBS repeat-containing protein [Acidobacteria bacterium]|nr:VCBS repeat-containing protein [Acidobacteriota bacterium]
MRMTAPRGILALAIVVSGAAVFLSAGAANEGSPAGGGAGLEDVVRANNRGAALMEQYKHAQAAEEFRKATAGRPGWAPGFVNLGLAALYAREADHAKSAFLEAVRLDQDLPQAHYGLALILKNDGKTAEAIAALRKAQALDPEDGDILYNLGLLYARQRDFEPAIASLTRAREIDPNSMSVRYQLARALLQAGRRAEGDREMAAYQKLSANPKFAVPTGTQYGEAGRYALVITDYRALGGPPAPPRPVEIRFSDAGAASGITFRHAGPGGDPAGGGAPGTTAGGSAAKDAGPRARAARYGSGVAVGDLNGDGLPDLVFANAAADGKARPSIHLNEGGLAFEDATPLSGVTFEGAGMAAALGDFDNDGDADLYLTRFGGAALYENDGKGRFKDVTAQAHAAVTGFPLGASWADVDHDGDLDLLVCRLRQPGGQEIASPVLLLNRGDGAFKDGSAEMKITGPPQGSVGAVFADFDADRDIDLVLASAGGPDTLLDNRRDRGFTARGKDAGLAARGEGRGVAAGDVDGDGLADLVFASGAGAPLRLYLNGARRQFTAREIPKPAGADAFGTVLFDADNDGDLDLFAAGSALLLYLNDGSGGFAEKTAASGLGGIAVKDGRGAAAADLDGDGDLDLVVTQNGGAPIVLRNEGGSRNRWLEVVPRGLNSNKEGIGTKIEVLAGRTWQRREVMAGGGYLSQSPPAAHFGLGERGLADVVRLLWPGGVLQSELDVPAGQRVVENELDRKGSSCPLLFAWNGRKYGFVTDFLGVGGLGLWTAPGVYGTPRPEEYVKIGPDELLPTDGAYRIQLLENLEEITYLDEVKLLVLDHPGEIEVYPLAAFGGKERQPHRVLAVRPGERVFPARARDHNDRDVTDTILKIDRLYPDNFRLDRLAGYAEMHHLTLEFPESVRRLERPVLFLYGWVDFEYSSANYAASQKGVVLTPPVLEMFDGTEGVFRPVLDPMGFPPGLPRMISVDLSQQAPLKSRQLRLRTNMRVFWDQVFLAEPLTEAETAEKVKVAEVKPAGAHLHRRGFPREHSPDGREPKIYDYSILDNTQPFRVMTGDYTRFGRVTELLTRTDDRFVIFGKGEEVSLEFPVQGLAEVPRRFRRSFMLYASGYCKDMDPHTAFPETVEPLPFRGMSSYPYPEGERYPDDLEHREYRRIWNTRRLQGR